MIGREASEWLLRLKDVLQRHGAAAESLTVVAQALGPMCSACLKAMNESIEED